MLKFSICIPAYKSTFLKECIESILTQDYTDFEVIILNDNSPEPVESIVKSFSDTRIVYFKNSKNVGAEKLIINWNICLEKSCGEYIIIMGDDDKLEKNYLSEFLNLISKYPLLDVYHCRTKIIDNKSDPIVLSPSWPEFESVYDNIWHRLTERRAQYISDFVYRASALKYLGGFYDLPLAWGSDDITAFRACINKGIANTNKPVFNYRNNDLSITKSGDYSIKMKSNILYEIWLKDFLKETPIDDNDKITHKNICINLKKYTQNRKIYLMINSMVNRTFPYLFIWIKYKKVYDITLTEIIYSLINSLKRRYSNRLY